LVLAVDEAVSNRSSTLTPPGPGQAHPSNREVELCVADRTAADASHRAVVTVTDTAGGGRESWGRVRLVGSAADARAHESVDVT